MIADDLITALADALAGAGIDPPAGGSTVTAATQREFGDFQSNVALRLQKDLGERGSDIAARIKVALDARLPTHVERVEVAGPGFLNFYLAPSWLHVVLRTVVADGEGFGRNEKLAGSRINLEFVSSNPTGPLHAGGGRWVAVGDAIANLLGAQGAEVHREYYVNDAGNQLDEFAASLHARVRGDEPPQDGYQGEYLIEMAGRLRSELGGDITVDAARDWGVADTVRALGEDLGRIGVHFDTWFSERLLHERGDVDAVLTTLRAAGHTYESDGATWFRSEDLGDQRDRVLVKSDGATTYLCNDLAYHRDKMARGWAHLIDIWGADHHGQVKSLQVGMAALGFGTDDAPEPEIILGQLVRLQRAGETVRLSKRTGNIVTLADILDEVDPDVARLTFLAQGIDTAQTFDLDVVTAQSLENPVYYVEYAHARAASIARVAAERNITRAPIDDVDLGLLVHERELEVLRSLEEFPAVLESAAELRAPHRVAGWVRALAGCFHGFYRDCHVLTDDAALAQARMWLAEAARIGLRNGLAILGVDAPDEMARLDVDADDPVQSGAAVAVGDAAVDESR